METSSRSSTFLYETVEWLAGCSAHRRAKDAGSHLSRAVLSRGRVAVPRWGTCHARGASAARRLRRRGRGRGVQGAPAPAAADFPARGAGALPWQAWLPEKVRALTASGQPVFVDFTAAWGVTCQVTSAGPDQQTPVTGVASRISRPEGRTGRARIRASPPRFRSSDGTGGGPVTALYPRRGHARICPKCCPPSSPRTFSHLRGETGDRHHATLTRKELP